MTQHFLTITSIGKRPKNFPPKRISTFLHVILAADVSLNVHENCALSAFTILKCHPASAESGLFSALIFLSVSGAKDEMIDS